MNGKASILLSGLVAILMVTCAVPFMVSEDSDALIGNTTGMSLNTNSAVLYLTGGDSSIDLEVTQMITGDDEEDVYWDLNDLDDGTSFVSLVDNQNGTYTVTALSIPNNQTVDSVKVARVDDLILAVCSYLKDAVSGGSIISVAILVNIQ